MEIKQKTKLSETMLAKGSNGNNNNNNNNSNKTLWKFLSIFSF